jgi:methyl-accepting chemotaxis protein
MKQARTRSKNGLRVLVAPGDFPIVLPGLVRKDEVVGDVVELISTVAGETSLLALNTIIEAARTSESGRACAVAASEARAQAAKATGEIGRQISGIHTATHESVGAIGELGGTIEKLSEISATSETGSASSQVLPAAQSLSGNSSRLKPEACKFLNTVRAA